MLERTFLHISGVGEKKERHIWKRGVRDWRGFMDRGRELLPKGLFELGRPVIERSLAALESPHGLAELAAMIPRAEHWRFWPRFEKVCYVDIECGGDETEWGGLSVVGDLRRRKGAPVHLGPGSGRAEPRAHGLRYCVHLCGQQL